MLDNFSITHNITKDLTVIAKNNHYVEGIWEIS